MAEDSQEKCTVSKEEGCILDSDERGIHPKLDMLLPRQRYECLIYIKTNFAVFIRTAEIWQNLNMVKLTH